MGRKSTKIRKPRLVEVREPSGRLSRAEDDRYGAAANKRLLRAAMRGMRDPEWGTALGCLYMEGRITAEMYGVGKWWRDTAAVYQWAINAPSQSPKAASLEHGRGGSDADPDTEAGRQRVATDRQAVKDFMEAHAILLSAGAQAERCVRDLCERDSRPIGFYEMTCVTRGLGWLADWRLTQKAKHGR